MRVVLTGGGTGGHVTPNLAVIEELKKKKGLELLYIGSRKGFERKLVRKVNVPYKAIFCGKFRRYFAWENFSDAAKVPVGIMQAYLILRRFKPHVIFSKGGFVSLPVVIAASRLKVPIIIHESDVNPGLTNKIAAKFANKICLSHEESRQYFKKYEKKVTVIGNPVRRSLLKGKAQNGFKFTGLNQHRPIILVMGGSQGAEQINDLIRASLDELLKKFQIVHIRGRGNLDISLHRKGYVQYEYIDEYLRDLYAICDMVISRGGANSLAEIAMLNKKALIIPLGLSASRGDQMVNAHVYADKFGWTVLKNAVSIERFVATVNETWQRDLPETKFKNGITKIVKLILKFG